MGGTTIVTNEAAGARRFDVHPWYRQFWPWFLIALPVASVVLSFVTLYMALETGDAVVPHEGDSTSYSAPSEPPAIEE
jgi:hypothetical protein